MGTPTLVLVTGPAGSGKTTLAHRLAGAIGCPALCRDEIKEGMVAAHPAGFVPTTSDPLTVRTYEVFFEAIELFVRSEVTLVAEAAFQHHVWWRGLAPLTGAAELRVLRCRVPDAVARERMAARMSVQETRRAHADAEHLSAGPPFDAIHVDAPTLDVDTSAGWRPALADIAAFCCGRA